ncbi:MAG: sugar nucleotide-binding protein [Thermoguttaceae bacterium]
MANAQSQSVPVLSPEQQAKILFTGGSGLLGSEMRKLLPAAHYPPRSEVDVTNYAQMRDYLDSHACATIVHAAAFTSPPKVDQDPRRAVDVNIRGTGNVVALCMERGIRLLYISTDYVFCGDRGNYNEDDAVLPVNKYAWSKLGGECAVRMHDNALIVRTSFGPNVFPYAKAFVDQWTSRQCVRRFAVKLLKLVASDLRGTIHVGGPRQTVHQYARSLDPQREIKPLSIREVPFRVPIDTSLDCSRYRKFESSLDPE